MPNLSPYRRPGPAVVTCAAALALASGCKPTPPPVPAPKSLTGQTVAAPPPAKEGDEQAAKALAAEADGLEASDKAGAEKKRDLIVDTYPGTLAAAEIFKARAEAAETQGDTEQAVLLYEKLLFYRPSFENAAAVREHYALLLLNVERFADAANMLRALYGAARLPVDQARLGLALGDALSQAGRFREALEVYVELSAATQVAADTRATANTEAFDILATALPFKDAEALWSDVQSQARFAPLLPALAFKLAKIYYHTRAYDRSEAMLKLVAAKFGDSPYGAPARDFLGKLKARFKVEPTTVGVVLPLSGKYQQYGERSLKAIKLAFASTPTIKVVVKDTAGEPAVAAKAVEDLVLDNNAIAVIGPLFSNEALAAALKAEELSVPIIALSHRAGLPELGDWVFRTALTVKAQAQELARVAIDQLKLKSFALLYPRSAYGEEFITSFWDEATKRGGEIRGAEGYEHDATSFQEPVKKLVGRYYLYARADYRDKIKELKALKLPTHRQAQALEKFEKTLPPIVDFDAIVIPDGSKNIGLIAPALAFEDIVLTRDPKMLEKIKKAMNRKEIAATQLLGASTWNSPQTVESCEDHCEHAVFVDAYYPDSPNPRVLDFVTGFRDATGAEPQLGEAQAFDTAGLVRFVLQNAKPAGRKAFQESLLKMPAYEGITGKMRFDKNGEVEKTLTVLTIIDRAIRLYEPTPEAPRG
ncbi:MAG: penicillin-binding protein activator [Deltaproteobacteria bacterium]|nr:penicillin-binding protein activator [Deltaproteobacteria bacterium]